MKKLKTLLMMGIFALAAMPIKAQPPQLVNTGNTEIYRRCGLVHESGVNWWKCDSLHPGELFTDLKPATGLGFFDSMYAIKFWVDNPVGMSHTLYQQYYKGLMVEHADYREHYMVNNVIMSNGVVCEGLNLSEVPEVLEENALTTALNYIDAELYAWEDDSIDYWLDSGVTHSDYYPEGELLYGLINDTLKILPEHYKLTWKFYIWTSIPYGHHFVYVDAISNEVVKVTPAASHGSFTHNFYGSQTLDTKFFGGLFNKFYTEANDNGHNFVTKDRAWGASWGTTSLASDGDDSWGSSHWAATMSHWGVEKAWDFWDNTFSRTGINDNGARIKVWADVADLSGPVQNAEFVTDKKGTNIKFGRRNSVLTASLDCAGHEYTHGVVANTAKLTNKGINGALNESYGDIFGFMTERFVFPTTFDWTIFEDVNAADVRDMEDPTSVETNLPHNTSPDFFPETYPKMVGDANFYTLSGDDGGVHINSTIQSRCFNLLAEGGSQNSTTVSGIGITKAAQIAEFALVNLLPSNADFKISREKWIAAAIILFGPCSNEHFQTCKAWRAVNVGPVCEPCAMMPVCWEGSLGDGFVVKNQDNIDDPINKIKIYPNPTNDKVNINLAELTIDKKNQLRSISIIDNFGRVVKNIDFTLTNKMSFSIADLTDGIYLLKFDFSNEVQTIRLIKD